MISMLHSGWAWFTLFIIVFTVAFHLKGLFSNKSYDFKVDFRLALFTLVITGIQIILGIINYFTADVMQKIHEMNFGDVMKVSNLRLLAVEHPTMGVLGFIVMLYGFRRMYYQIEPKRKFLSITIFYSLGLLLFLSRIPWDHWL